MEAAAKLVAEAVDLVEASNLKVEPQTDYDYDTDEDGNVVLQLYHCEMREANMITKYERNIKLLQVRKLLQLAMEISDSVSNVETDYAASISADIYEVYHRIVDQDDVL